MKDLKIISVDSITAFPKVTDACCNICGEEIGKYIPVYYVTGQFGYPSVYDGMNFRVCVCSDCMEEFVDSCKINPFVDNEGNV